MPGLIKQAQARYRINLSHAFMVGDNAKDIECGRNAGCGCAILVQSGIGPDAAPILAAKAIYPDLVAKDLLEAVEWIVRTRFRVFPAKEF